MPLLNRLRLWLRRRFPRAPRSAHPARLSSGGWQATAILAPLLLLAALGIRGLQISRQATLDDARRQAERELDQTSPALAASWRQRRVALAPPLYDSPPSPAPASEAQSLYERALLLENPAQADAELARLLAAHPDAPALSGVPLAPLAEWARLRLETRPAALAARADALARAAVETHPSILSPDLLAAAAALLAARGADPAPLADWQNRWADDEQKRAVLRQHAPAIAAAPTGARLWVRDDANRRWWIERDPAKGELRMLSFAQLSDWAAAMRAKNALPAFQESVAPDLTLDGVSLLSPAPLPTRETLARRDLDGGLAMRAALVAPDRLFTRQRQQTLWLAALLGSAVAAALAGFGAMRRALTRERQLGQLKSDFVSSVSHELRAPVAAMRLMAENLESGAVTAAPRRREYHLLIAEECRRLSALIDNVLDFARIEQDRKTYDFAETDAAALVRDAIQFMEPRALQRRQQLLAAVPPIDPPPCCDGLAVRQALINLLDNAIKFSPEGTSIQIHLRAHGADAWEIAVRDEGPGIPAAEHEKIFERFYRLGSELRRETQGAGIGLSIVRHIVQAHGGRVELDSRPGAGAAFTLVLPLLPPDSKTAN